jgi:murein peptide amidase A
VQRLGKNKGRYCGESIDIHAVLQDIEQAIADKSWLCDRIHLESLSGKRKAEFIAYRRGISNAKHSIYLSTGIHGDEPAGPLAVLQLLRENTWPKDTAIWLCPCLNLTGFPENKRENYAGVDLNRDYRHLVTEEIRTHVSWLGQQPNFDVTLCLHEDWESQGFYLFEQNPDSKASFSERIISSVEEICPIDRSPEIEGWPAQNGIIRPGVNPDERPQWPESVYLIKNKTRLAYTLEAPSDFPLNVRVASLVTACRTVLNAL